MKFKKGDEIFTEKKYKSLIKNKPYKVINIYRTPGFIESYKHYTLEIKNELGVIGSYSPCYFHKTKKQIRIDKFKKLIKNESI